MAAMETAALRPASVRLAFNFHDLHVECPVKRLFPKVCGSTPNARRGGEMEFSTNASMTIARPIATLFVMVNVAETGR
ncbi:hypothetical protein AB1Y20_012651 [Prymnesium parvum]|uniref:FACT complex subunit n=1 Tax=Prymnesium parvum TaxID=97485 RepID=A0AB34IK00_PRYPA